MGDIATKHQRWKKEFPRIHPHYAIKCNSDPVLLRSLMAMGTGFDCASKVRKTGQKERFFKASEKLHITVQHVNWGG